MIYIDKNIGKWGWYDSIKNYKTYLSIYIKTLLLILLIIILFGGFRGRAKVAMPKLFKCQKKENRYSPYNLF